MIDLGGQIHVVAGAGGGGIGTSACLLLARAGATVLAVDKTDLGCASATEALAQYGPQHRVVQADLTDEAALADALADAGPVRGLVNVVGGITSQDLIAPLLATGAMDIFDRLMRFNTVPTLAAARTVARAMVGHGQGGSIVNIASAAGLAGMPFGAGYAAAKAALINLTRTMAAEWGGAGVRVNAIAPGSIATAKLGRQRFDGGADEKDRAAKAVVPLGRRGLPEDIAGVALFLLSDLAAYVSGQVIAVDGGMLARPPYNDADGLPVFMTDPALRERLLGD
ncbi:SDR family oxidoreductase [Sphingomonas sp. C8-2]|jgi:NAD(P)-dependent dehydrogenase (short-subunit alcohol dehydrogenase family)|nr:SDR family oxidoreductase [Sphingomonas sp. C8-2]